MCAKFQSLTHKNGVKFSGLVP
ncbi:unnamed protein product [Ectocarpus sp. CCAP 1310/34]|nr:unnamed protein product [Ectocarpus sp. CCAP 1310/34]